MVYGDLERVLGIRRAVKRKVFVSYHHDGDQPFYDAFSRQFCDTYDVISDNSLDRIIDSDDVEYVMRRYMGPRLKRIATTPGPCARDTD